MRADDGVIGRAGVVTGWDLPIIGAATCLSQPFSTAATLVPGQFAGEPDTVFKPFNVDEAAWIAFASALFRFCPTC